MDGEPKPQPAPQETETGLPLTLESPRAVFYTEPPNDMWPIRLHDRKIRRIVEKSLPYMVQALSRPVEPASKDKVQEIFRSGRASKRQRQWEFTDEKEGGYSVRSRGFREKREGKEYIISGVRCVFDRDGRMTKLEYIDDEQYSYSRGQTTYSESFVYDEDGYLIQRSLWEKYRQPVVDRFDYVIGPDGKKTPTLMTRVGRTTDGSDTKPITVDLAHWQEWLETNPNGFTRVEKESLNPQELRIEGYTVTEHRSGIHFANPEQLERALVMYGTGKISGETAQRYDEKVYTENYGPLGEALFVFAGRGDIPKFVQEQIMERVSQAYEAVQNSRDPNAREKVYRSFDYDGVGQFYKTSVNIEITKGGVELHLSAAYVGDQVEESLARALGQERGFRSATIEVPVNQTEKEGYFLIDVAEACKKMGIPVTEEQAGEYITEWFEAYQRQSEKGSYDAKYGERPILWEDPSRGVTVTLGFTRDDYDADVDLQQFFSADEKSIWGPLPKNIRSPEKDVRETYPKIRILVKPQGNPFDKAVAQQARDTIHAYTSKLG